MNISDDIQQKMICPANHAPLLRNGDFLENAQCTNIRYPIINEIPILINDENSLFSIQDFVTCQNTTFDLHPGRLKTTIRKITPKIGANIKALENYKTLAGLLPKNAKILVIGGSIKGHGMDPIYDSESFEIVGTDVSFGKHTKVVCDAHDLPFADGTFDCVISQAVLEHVLDPHRCVAEIHRVLKPTGLVYAETPFMAQVHMKQYDFTRFTHLGHRWLFRNFEEIKSGPCCGPGMAMAWSYTYFLRSFAKSKFTSRLITAFAQVTSFFYKYFDYFLIDRPGSYDASLAFYFMGRKSEHPIPAKELLKNFKGLR